MIRLAPLLALTLMLSACLQGVGDRCQVTGDCQDGLVCSIPAGGTAVTGGMCQKQATADGGVVVTQDLQAAPDQSAAQHDDLASVD